MAYRTKHQKMALSNSDSWKLYRAFRKAVDGANSDAFNEILRDDLWAEQKFLNKTIKVRDLAKILIMLSKDWDDQIEKHIGL